MCATPLGLAARISHVKSEIAIRATPRGGHNNIGPVGLCMLRGDMVHWKWSFLASPRNHGNSAHFCPSREEEHESSLLVRAGRRLVRVGSQVHARAPNAARRHRTLRCEAIPHLPLLPPLLHLPAASHQLKLRPLSGHPFRLSAVERNRAQPLRRCILSYPARRLWPQVGAFSHWDSLAPPSWCRSTRLYNLHLPSRCVEQASSEHAKTIDWSHSMNL